MWTLAPLNDQAAEGQEPRLITSVKQSHRAIVSDLCLDPRRAERLNDTPEKADGSDRDMARQIGADYVEARNEEAAGN